MFTISLCMIVKNESDVLERILKQAKKFADEIVVVDTGSTDNTKQIAKMFTTKVYDFKWVQDFSKARNFAFSLGICDYLMWLDADDFITDAEIEKIKTLKKSEQNADVFMFKYAIGFDADNHPQTTYFRERLLKRKCNFQWQGFVHEVICPAGKIEYTNIEIQHRKMKSGDPKRNLKLYQNAIKNGTILNPRELYYYSRELYYNNQISKAIKNFKKFLKIENTFPPDNFGAYIMLSDCFCLQNDYKSALKTLLNCLEKHTPNAELCCKIGYVCEKLANNQAIFWFEAALLTKAQQDGFVNEDFQSFIPHLELSRLLYSSDFAKAKQHHLKAKAIKSNHPAVKFNEKFFKN